MSLFLSHSLSAFIPRSFFLSLFLSLSPRDAGLLGRMIESLYYFAPLKVFLFEFPNAKLTFEVNSPTHLCELTFKNLDIE